MSVTNIILVEDDQWLAEMYARVLQQLPKVNLRTAGTADEALALLDEQSADLLVLDLFLPEHNGVELLHELASHEDVAQVPVIILSAVFEHELGLSRERWRHYNVIEYLYKPAIKPTDLVSAVEKHLLLEAKTT